MSGVSVSWGNCHRHRRRPPDRGRARRLMAQSSRRRVGPSPTPGRFCPGWAGSPATATARPAPGSRSGRPDNRSKAGPRRIDGGQTPVESTPRPDRRRLRRGRADLLVTKHAPPIQLPGKVDATRSPVAAARGLVLVSAPPGYGKTTLVAGWLDASGAGHGLADPGRGRQRPGGLRRVPGRRGAPRARPGTTDRRARSTRTSASRRHVVVGSLAPLVNAIAAPRPAGRPRARRLPRS